MHHNINEERNLYLLIFHSFKEKIHILIIAHDTIKGKEKAKVFESDMFFIS